MAICQFVPITLQHLLGVEGAEQLTDVLTDHAIAHRQDGVATDPRGFVKSTVKVEITLETDTRTGHIRAGVAVRGGLTKLKGLVRVLELESGALVIEAFEETEEAPLLVDPTLKDRQALAAERRREGLIDIGERRRTAPDVEADQAAGT